MATGLYLHIPFCRHRCSYCDFNTYVDQDGLREPYAEALAAEIRARAGEVRPVAHTVFFGGGTPSLMSGEQLARLVEACRSAFALPDDAEITLEANPGTVTLASLREMRALGINRLSFGAQSADPGELALLGREHGWREVGEAVATVRAAGFDNVNIDLIYGLPHQPLASWQRTVRAALALAPEHISLYALSIETGTPLHERTRRGELPLPDPDAAADMYEHAEQVLGDAGYAHYEISNWARPGRACAHNLIYWRNEPYFGLGAGAHSSSIQRRWWNARRPADYIARAAAGPEAIRAGGIELAHEDIDAATSRGETMMLGLRLLEEGITHARFEARYGAPMTTFFQAALDQAVGEGLLTVDAVGARLTERGRFLSNRVFRLLV
ncbi:MAG: radical SAM family heme chaperone HemW [Thermoflexales bacterium]|nr:radical SAM family heme chaperone HemW [Thermoflexales bacterium]